MPWDVERKIPEDKPVLIAEKKEKNVDVEEAARKKAKEYVESLFLEWYVEVLPKAVSDALDRLVESDDPPHCTWEGIEDTYCYLYLYKLPHPKLSKLGVEIIKKYYKEGVAYMAEVKSITTHPATEKATSSTFTMVSSRELDGTEELNDFLANGGFLLP